MKLLFLVLCLSLLHVTRGVERRYRLGSDEGRIERRWRLRSDETVRGTRAKCEGEWAIHACLGGNGKRSQQRRNIDSPTEEKDNLLLNKQFRSVLPTLSARLPFRVEEKSYY
uniref:LEP n=1 Tax=Hirudo nipponia TaxID=42736 RepID=Q25104_HIRNI|nr:LEP precursor [Hirudo nipponia]